MPRTVLTKSTAPGATDTLGADLTLDAADDTNFNEFTLTGNEVVIAYNSGVAVALVTITSFPDRFGRSGDIAKSVAAGEAAVFGPFSQEGWRQAGGALYLQADAATVLFGVISLTVVA